MLRARDNARQYKKSCTLTLPILQRYPQAEIQQPDVAKRQPVITKRRIRLTTRAEVEKLYLLGGEPDEVASLAPLPDSAHPGTKVQYATRYKDNETVVVKTRSRKDSFKSLQAERDWRTTTEFQLNLPRVESLCHYYEVCETRELYYVFMERVEGKDLFEQMANGDISHRDSREIIRQVLEGLAALHAHGRVHKDLKLENVMVEFGSLGDKISYSGGSSPDSKGSPVAKVIDFDTVQEWGPESGKAGHVTGTDGYIAPEAYDGMYSPASDMYAVGAMMYTLLTGCTPTRCNIFDDKPGENYVGSPCMRRVQSRLRREVVDFSVPPLDACPEARELVRGMLAVDAEDRPSATEALGYAWFLVDTDELP